MKKRLLITSIVMMLVVAVALSTATYAWFTSNAKVEASSMTLRASTSDASSLSIGWTTQAAGTSLTSTVNVDTLSPMAPEHLTVGSTTSADLFKTSTTYSDASVIKFNTDGSTVAPITYQNQAKTISSFYVKNASPANTVNSVTVKAVFSDYMVALNRNGTYVFEADVAYYTSNGSTYNTYAATPEQAYAPATNDPQVYAYVPYVATLDTTAKKGVTYYEQGEGDVYSYSEATVQTGDSVTGKFEKIGDADDMIRVALYTRVFKTVAAAAVYSSDLDYYSYNVSTDVFAKVDTITNADTFAAAKAATTLYAAPKAYTLDVVLAKDKTTGTSVAEGTFNLNEIYFTESEGVYSQDKTVTADNWDSKKSGLYTCTYTAVYGSILKDGAVKAMDYYTGVVNSRVIANSELAPGEQIEIIAKAWLDGTLLDDKRANQIGTVSLEFSAN